MNEHNAPDGELNRIADLEIAIGHQQKVIDELHEVVAIQSAEISEMRRRLEVLTRRFLAVEESVGGDVPVDKPPHW